MKFEELHYPEPYDMQDGYLGYWTYNHKGDAKFNRICNFFPYVELQVIIDDGVNRRAQVKIGAFSSEGTPLKSLTVSDQQFIAMDWHRAEWGYENNIESNNVKDKLRHAIQCTAKHSEKTFIYETTGWKQIDGEWCYLMPGDEAHTVSLSGRCDSYGMDRSKDITTDDLLNMTGLLYQVAPKEIMFPLIAFAFLSPLNTFLRKARCEPKTILMLTGKTGAKKSTLAALILSFFGRFSTADLPSSFRDTANSIVKQGFYLKDVLTCIDDFHPSTGRDEKEMKEKMQTVLRAYGNRTGRGRLNSKAELMKDCTPQGNAIITAEFLPDVGESGTARYLCLDLKQGDVNNSELTKYQHLASDGMLSAVMLRYTEWIKEKHLADEERFVKGLAAMFESRRTVIQKRAEKENVTLRDRLIDDLITLSFGFGFFTDYLKSNDVITPDTAAEMNREFETILLSLAKNQQKKTEEDQPTHVFLKKFFSLLDSDRITLIPKDRPEILGRENSVGYEDAECFYLDTSLVHKEVRRLCVDQGESFSITEKGLLSALANEKLLLKDADGRNTRQIRIGNTKRRLLVIPKETARRSAEE